MVLVRFGKLGLYWELFNYADQKKIEGEVIECLKVSRPLLVARMVAGIGRIVSRERRVSVDLKKAMVAAVQRCARRLMGGEILMVMEG